MVTPKPQKKSWTGCYLSCLSALNFSLRLPMGKVQLVVTFGQCFSPLSVDPKREKSWLGPHLHYCLGAGVRWELKRPCQLEDALRCRRHSLVVPSSMMPQCAVLATGDIYRAAQEGKQRWPRAGPRSRYPPKGPRVFPEPLALCSECVSGCRALQAVQSGKAGTCVTQQGSVKGP